MSEIKPNEVPRFRAAVGGAFAGLRALLLPLHEMNLLLPNAAVAEVIRYQEPETAPGMPAWWLGRLSWRGIYIPLISFEAFAGDAPPPPQARRRIAVLNTLNGNHALPFLALIVAGTPHLQGVTPELISPGDTSADADGILCALALGGHAALIPDLDALETAVLNATARARAQGAR